MTTISCVDTYNLCHRYSSVVSAKPHCHPVQLLEMHPAVSCHRTFVPAVSSAWNVLLLPQLLLLGLNVVYCSLLKISVGIPFPQ